MDYKLEALHKSYQSRIVAWIVSFIAGFTIAAALIITAAFLKSDVIAIIGGSLFLISIVALAIVCFTNCTTPEWLEKAEQEYQRELKKITEKERFDKKWEEIKAENIKAMQKVRDEKLDYIIAHFDTLTNVIDRREWELNQPNINDTPKQSALDKKLGSKAKK